jgi:choline dehydrogenase-like flavoprotein
VSGEIIEARALSGDVELACDVVVVGSGAGGAVVATELALAGQDVVVLEEGPQISAAEHGAMRQSESLRHVWREAGTTAAIGLFGAPTVNVTMGRVLGGSSMLTGGVCFRTPESVLDGWAREMRAGSGQSHGLDSKGLEPCFEHVERAIHVEEVPIGMRSRSTQLFAEGAARRGHPVTPVRRNTLGCNGCGRCNFGCPHQAKLSVDLAYLPRAVEAGARLYTDCLVERVRIEHGRAVGVEGRTLDGEARRRGRLRVKARRVVVAAGGVHSPALLTASGLGGVGSHVGRGLTLHPGFRVFARFDETVRGWSGALQSAYSDRLFDEGVIMMSLFVPGSVIAAQLPGVGPAHAALAAHVDRIAMFGVMVHDEGGGAVVRNPFGREPFLFYRWSAHDRRAMCLGLKEVSETFFAAGAKEVFLPILGLPGLDADALRRFDWDRVPAARLECASQHPLGACRMGPTAGVSVVDASGESWDVRELFVVDGSILPSSLGVNPQVTIMAMATRIAWRLRERPLPT